jgi:hypothetical protein
MPKKLAAVALIGSVALPLGGAAAFVGSQAAGAASGPLLTCTAINPSNGVGGGDTFGLAANGSDAGTQGIDFQAGPAGTMNTKGTIKNGATTVILTTIKPNQELAVTGETLTIPGATNGPFTVTSDSFGATPPHVPDTVTVTPAINTGSPTATIASSTVVNVSATPNGVYRSINDAVFTNSTTLKSVNPEFVPGDVGQPISGEIGVPTKAVGFPPPGNGPSPTNVLGAAIPGDILAITGYTSSTQVTVSAIPSTQTVTPNPGFTPPASYPSNEPEAITWTGANSGAGPTYPGGLGTITIGLTTSAPQNLYESLHYAASGCTTGAANFYGDYAPETATLNGITTATISNSAIGVENAPVATQFNITYPDISATGWGDLGGNAPTGVQPTTTLNFSVKNAFVLIGTNGACVSTANCDSYTKGVANWNPTGGPLMTGAANGDYGTPSKGSLGLAANGLVFCTLAETEGINLGTGPDAALHNKNPLLYCDGGSSNPYGDTSPGTALGVIINLEENPQASVYGGDNTAPSSIWNIVAQQASNAIW